jgi:hypothetical protein
MNEIMLYNILCSFGHSKHDSQRFSIFHLNLGAVSFYVLDTSFGCVHFSTSPPSSSTRSGKVSTLRDVASGMSWGCCVDGVAVAVDNGTTG